MADWLIDNPFFYNNVLFFIHHFERISIFIVILFIIGVIRDKPESFLAANFIVQVFLAIYLIYRFNHYRKEIPRFNDLDRKICYYAGVYILTFSFLEVLQTYTEKFRKLIDPYTVPIVNKIKGIVSDTLRSSRMD